MMFEKFKKMEIVICVVSVVFGKCLLMFKMCMVYIDKS